ncbi:hypothetical protein M758_3G027200 [Ceratodon purpureus]|uniref:Uncharacterized protein n=1 Tax=Ceratodon purpureus TaxID=3225 RepID=A0A8T0IGI4_CERPU|nr:hypothetical protein KC19_3G027800 [Ceratodon purpureus]KAG0621532.1 hypothetical protein M758_3G027200 [Ceratodon purpureus]
MTVSYCGSTHGLIHTYHHHPTTILICTNLSPIHPNLGLSANYGSSHDLLASQHTNLACRPGLYANSFHELDRSSVMCKMKILSHEIDRRFVVWKMKILLPILVAW